MFFHSMNKFIHGAVRNFYVGLDRYPITMTVATVTATTVCGITLYQLLEYLEGGGGEGQTNNNNNTDNKDTVIDDWRRRRNRSGEIMEHMTTTGTTIQQQYDGDDETAGGGGDNNNQDTTTTSEGLYLGHDRPGQQYSKHVPVPTMTLERARLQAMIENAQQSSWRENIENATFAQERFMLPGRYPGPDDNNNHHSSDDDGNSTMATKEYPNKINNNKKNKKKDFMTRINERSHEIMKQHQQQQQQQRQQAEEESKRQYRDENFQSTFLEQEKDRRRKFTTKIW